MLTVNYSKVRKNFDSAIGGLANEKRFEEWFEGTYIREHRRFTLPSLGSNGLMVIEQGWNEHARKKRVIKVVVEQDDKEIEMVFRLEDFEQAIFAMTQGDEVVKYIKTEKRAQRKGDESARQTPVGDQKI
jgi:hypothetical protein